MAFTNTTLAAAVTLWSDDNSNSVALSNYGHINTWDTSLKSQI